MRVTKIPERPLHHISSCYEITRSSGASYEPDVITDLAYCVFLLSQVVVAIFFFVKATVKDLKELSSSATSTRFVRAVPKTAKAKP